MQAIKYRKEKKNYINTTKRPPYNPILNFNIQKLTHHPNSQVNSCVFGWAKKWASVKGRSNLYCFYLWQKPVWMGEMLIQTHYSLGMEAERFNTTSKKRSILKSTMIQIQDVQFKLILKMVYFLVVRMLSLFLYIL